MESQQITRIPIKYGPILNRLSNESVGKIFKNILFMEENLNEEEKIYYDLIMIDIIAINKKAGFGRKGGASGVKGKEYGKQGGRPKVKKTNPPKEGLNNPPNIIKDNIIKDNIDIFIEKWNGVSSIENKKGLPAVRVVNENLIKAWNRKTKEYTVEEILQAVNNYCNEIASRTKRNENDTYPEHRFSLIEFLTREKGLDKFINYK